MFRITNTSGLCLLALLGVDCVALDREDSAASVEMPAFLDPAMVQAARDRLGLLEGMLDQPRLATYRLEGAPADQFLRSQFLEYGNDPDLLKRRVEVLASSALLLPGERPGPVPRHTPFHDLTSDDSVMLARNQARVFERHASDNGGSTAGIAPFSVCETRFLIDVSKGKHEGEGWAVCGAITDYDAYAQAYASYASTCSDADVEDWYAYQGASSLSPRSLEPTIAEAFAVYLMTMCAKEPAMPACSGLDADRPADRRRQNQELALRELYYEDDPGLLVPGSHQGTSGQGPTMSLAEYLRDPKKDGVLVPDRNGDGIGEWLAVDGLRLSPGTPMRLPAGAQVSAPTALSGTVLRDASSARGSIQFGERVRLDAGTPLALLRAMERTSDSTAPIALGTTITVAAGGFVHSQRAGDFLVFPGVRLAIELDQPLTIQVAGPVQGATVEFLPPPNGQEVVVPRFELRAMIPLAGGGSLSFALPTQTAIAYDQVEPVWNPGLASRPDLGLIEAFGRSEGCQSDPTFESCPLLARLATLMDRHENLYDTYVGLAPESPWVVDQVTPLTAASMTLNRAIRFAMDGGRSRERPIQVLRIPFQHLLTRGARSVDTLSLLGIRVEPPTQSIQKLARGEGALDLGRAWLDSITLSHGQYPSETSVAHIGPVPAEQMEALLVIDSTDRRGRIAQPGVGCGIEERNPPRDSP